MAPVESNKHPNSSTKPCRACTDFKTWAKLNKSEIELPGETQDTHVNNNCPLDKDKLGRSTWDFLHTLAAYYPDNPTESKKNETKEFFRLFALMYPCDICAADLQKQLERFPPKADSQKELTQWLCRVHNRINLKLGKSLFDCTKVDERWRDGWKDGSCD